MFAIYAVHTGKRIDSFPTKKEAEKAIVSYEAEDKEHGMYSENSYEVKSVLPLSEPEKAEIRDAVEIIKKVVSEYESTSVPFDTIDYLDTAIADIERTLVNS